MAVLLALPNMVIYWSCVGVYICQVPVFCGLYTLEKVASRTSWFLGRSGRHLFLTDNDNGKPPLLLQMASDTENLKFMWALITNYIYVCTIWAPIVIADDWTFFLVYLPGPAARHCSPSNMVLPMQMCILTVSSLHCTIFCLHLHFLPFVKTQNGIPYSNAIAEILECYFRSSLC